MGERDGIRRHFLQPQTEYHFRRKDEGNGDEEHREISGFGSQTHQGRATVQIARSIVLHYLRRDGFLRIVGKCLKDGTDGIGDGKSCVHRGAEEHVDDERTALRLAYRGNGTDAYTDGEIEHVIILAPLTHKHKAGDGSKLPTAIGEKHQRGEGGHECHHVGIDNQLVLEMVDEQISEEQLEKAHRHVRGAEHEEALTGYEQSVIGHADERHSRCHDGDIKDTQHGLHVAVIADMVHDIPMSGGQGYRHGQQGNEHMYDKIDIKLTAHLLLVVLANGYGNETVGRGHHNGVDDAYEGDDAGYDRIESVVAYTQSLQTEACIEQSAYGMVLDLPASFSKLEYYGRGPEENYIDRHSSTFIGKYESDVKDEYYPYIRPQESGNHTDIRYFSIFNPASGKGITFEGYAPMECSAIPYSIKDLDSGDEKEHAWGQHSGDLVDKGLTQVHIQQRQYGLGCIDSWMTKPMEKYRMHYGDREFRFVIKAK